MQFKAFEPGIEVSGGSVHAVIAAFSLTPSVASRYLSEHGILRVQGQVNVDRNDWFSLDSWLSAYEAIARSSAISLFNIGMSIPKNAKFPPHIKDIESAMNSIDVAYHMNHRKSGRPMFDERTGKMVEGIGHYECRRAPNENKIICTCHNPYPCDFDRGLLTAMAGAFAKNAKVVHDDNGPCRKRKDDMCKYIVTW